MVVEDRMEGVYNVKLKKKQDIEVPKLIRKQIAKSTKNGDNILRAT